MDIKRKRTVLLVGVFLHLIPQPNTKASISCNVKTAIACAGGIIFAGLIGRCLYDKFRTLTDSEEIIKAQQLYDYAESQLSNISLRYERELHLLPKSSDDRGKAKLKREICNSGDIVLPFLHFKKKLDNSIRLSRRIISDITSSKNHLLERKLRLTQKDYHESTDSYIRQYEQLCSLFDVQKKEIKAVYKNLKRLRRFVVGQEEYRQELVLYRLNKLEMKISGLADRLNYVPPTCHHQHPYCHSACSCQWNTEERIRNLDYETEKLIEYELNYIDQYEEDDEYDDDDDC